MSLRGKLVAFIIGAVALIQLSWGLNVVRTDAKLLEGAAQHRNRAILHAIAAPAAIHLATREFESLDAVLELNAITIPELPVISAMSPERIGA